MLPSDDDRIGKLARECFHIVKIGANYYYTIDVDEEKYYNKQGRSEVTNYSLVNDGKRMKLPWCDSFFSHLKRRDILEPKNQNLS